MKTSVNVTALSEHEINIHIWNSEITARKVSDTIWLSFKSDGLDVSIFFPNMNAVRLTVKALQELLDNANKS